jgi:flagellar motor switch protein FliM
MGERLLNSSEIDALLGMFRGASGPVADAPPYELDTPSIAPRTALEGVVVRHEQAARAIRDEFAAILNLDVDVVLEGFEQVRFGSLRDGLEAGACCFLGELPPLRDPAFLALDPQLAFAAVDRLLGGKGDGAGVSREMTPTESAVVEEILRPVVAAHATAWSAYTAVKAGGVRSVVGPRYVRELKSEDVLFAARYRFKGFADGALLRFATPASGLEPHLQKDPRPIAPAKDGSGERELREHLAQVGLAVRVRVGGARLTLRELTHLEPDDVVVLDRPIGDGCELCVAGAPKFTGWLGQSRGRLTYRVQRAVGAKPPAKKEQPPAAPAKAERAR